MTNCTPYCVLCSRRQLTQEFEQGQLNQQAAGGLAQVVDLQCCNEYQGLCGLLLVNMHM